MTFLTQIRVLVYLVVGRLVFEAWLVENGFNLLLVEVGDADSFDQTSIHQLFHPLRTGTIKRPLLNPTLLISGLAPSHFRLALV